MKTIKIASDGTPKGTHVFDAAGAEIGGVAKITWTLDARSTFGKATIEFDMVEVEVVAESAE